MLILWLRAVQEECFKFRSTPFFSTSLHVVVRQFILCCSKRQSSRMPESELVLDRTQKQVQSAQQAMCVVVAWE